jgi:predicted transcriptional regulator
MSELTKEQVKTFAKTALDLNLPAKEIAKLLGIHRSTVYRYSDQPTPEELQQFATEIKQLVNVKRYVTLAKLLRKIESLSDSPENIRDISYAFDTLNKRALYSEPDSELEDKQVTFTITRGY